MSTPTNLRLAFVLEAIDKATKVIRTINEEIEKSTEPARKIKAAFGSLVRESGLPRLGEQLTVIKDKTLAAKDAAFGIARTWASIAGVATGFFWILKKNIDEVDHANDLAQQLGVSVEMVQKLGYAAQLSGSSQEEMAEALMHLNRALVEGRQGSKEALVWFKLLGLSQKDLAHMDAVQVYEKMADVFQRVGDTGQNASVKIALLTALTGRSGGKMKQMLDGGSASIKQLYVEAERLGVVIDGKTAQSMADFNDDLDRLKYSIFGIFAAISKTAVPAMDAITKKLTEANVASRGELGERLGKMFSEVIVHAPGVFTALGQISGKMVEIWEAADKVAQALGGWETVFNILIDVGIAKLIVALVSLGINIVRVGLMARTFALTTGPLWIGVMAGAAAEAWALAGAMLAATWPFLLIGAAIVGVAFVIFKYWAPIKKFVTGLWDEIIDYVSAKVAAIVEIVRKVTGFIHDITSAFSSSGELSVAGDGSTSIDGVNAAASPFGAARAQVGGTVHIQIDSAGRANVQRLTSDNPDVPLSVGYTGATMAGF